MLNLLAFDLGASNGRAILGQLENDKITMTELHRFENNYIVKDGVFYWDLPYLFENLKQGFKAFKEANVGELHCFGIDTWGVDYGLVGKDGEVLGLPRAYRYAVDADMDRVFKIVDFPTQFSRTGIAALPFNTVYQLYADKKAGRLEGVTDFLMIPEYLMYKLTGNKVKEFTNATTGGIINADTLKIDEYIWSTLGLPTCLAGEVYQPGTLVGRLTPEIVAEVGGDLEVVLCATHDTGSAVEGIPMSGNHPYISSGTWSLLGVKTPKPITNESSYQSNYSNEGGVGYNRYLKNIMGMWLINELRKELCPDTPFPEIVKMAEESDCRIIVDANAQEFLAPESMKAAFDKAANGGLKTAADYFCCAYRSLAITYRDALNNLELNTGETYDKLYIVGGGAKNQFLNRLTEEATGKKVIALPIEATALGNLKVQLEA